MKWLNWLINSSGISVTLKTCEQHKKELEEAKKEIENWKKDFESAIEIGKKLKDQIEELQKLNTKPDVNDEQYWNNKWNKNKIYYSAPKRTLIKEFVKYREIKEVTEISKEIIKQKQNIDDIPLLVLKWLEDKFNKKEFRYVTEKGEIWNTPEDTLKFKFGDCDDFGILEYYIIRECFKQLNKWDEVKHRLKCSAGNVNNKGSIPSSAGGHFYLIWLHSDGEWYVIESTYFRTIAILNYGELPHKLNPMYGIIWFSFNECESWAQNSFAVSKEDFKKIIKVK